MSVLTWWGCSSDKDEELQKVAAYRQDQNAALTCNAESMRYPTNKQDFDYLLYGSRGFLAEYQGYKHLGHDIVYAEGTVIHPISCGIVRFYGPATGYGTLVAVVEHKLETPLATTNGNGEQTIFSSFMSIYGHLRKTSLQNGGNPLTWKVGDTIKPTDTIGYIQTDALNGDGPEHLHLGIRLQSMADAQSVDMAWFRGNDSQGEGSYKKYYTNPATFIPDMEMFLEGNEFGEGNPQGSSVATNHPIGTLLKSATGGKTWIVVAHGRLLDVSTYQHLRTNCAVTVAQQVLDCYEKVAFDPISMELDAQVIKFQGEPQVYRIYPGAGFTPSAFQVFLSYESFLSWGYKDADIKNYVLEQKSTILGQLKDKGQLGFMPGTLVKGQGQSEVSVANQSGVRRPILNWDVFEELGYGADCIYEIESSTLNMVAGIRSEQLITLDEVQQCLFGVVAHVCVPGTYIVCDCPQQQSGTQICNLDGLGYQACSCPVVEPDAGQFDAGADVAVQPCGGLCGAGTHCDIKTDTCILDEIEAGMPIPDSSAPDANSPPVEICNGLDDDLDGQVDETFSCIAGKYESCTTWCNSPGVRRCNLNTCMWESCQPAYAEICANGADEDCNSLIDCQDPHCAQDAYCQVTVDAGTADSALVLDASVVSETCQTQGTAGKVTFMIQAPVVATDVISVYGWIDQPGWSGVADTAWSGWAWGLLGMQELVFSQGAAYTGAKFVFAPGVSTVSGQSQKAWYCDQIGCPIGTYIVCSGTQEICRVQNGALFGGAAYIANSSGWQNIQCTLP